MVKAIFLNERSESKNLVAAISTRFRNSLFNRNVENFLLCGTPFYIIAVVAYKHAYGDYNWTVNFNLSDYLF